mgnify:CR=1 FL=1
MIVRITECRAADGITYNVEYSSGKCRKYYTKTKSIADFIAVHDYIRVVCNNGKMTFYIWG